MAKVIKLKNDTYLYGTIIEEGSNANGEYIKFSNGTLIQQGYADKTFFKNDDNNYSTVQGINWYRSNNSNPIYFPISFKNTNYRLLLTVYNGISGTRIAIPRINSKDTNRFNAQLIGVESWATNGVAYQNLNGVEWRAIGKWK